jgi:hypothetical protein
MAPPDVVVNFLQQQAPRLDGAGVGIERREAAGDFVGVQEAQALYFLRQKFFGEGGLAAPLQPAIR